MFTAHSDLHGHGIHSDANVDAVVYHIDRHPGLFLRWVSQRLQDVQCPVQGAKGKDGDEDVVLRKDSDDPEGAPLCLDQGDNKKDEEVGEAHLL